MNTNTSKRMRVGSVLVALAVVSAVFAAETPTSAGAAASLPMAPSTRYGGWYANKALYTDADATWPAPEVDSTGKDSRFRQYVALNIGGTNAHPLVAAGTETQDGGRGNFDKERAWLVVGSTTTFPSIHIDPGDRVYAHVSLTTAGAYMAKIVVTDWSGDPTTTRTTKVTGVLKGASPDGHAEWVADKGWGQALAKPSYSVIYGRSLGSAVFIAPRAVYGGAWHNLNQLPKAAMRYVNSSNGTVAVPSGLATDGTFSVWYVASR